MQLRTGEKRFLETTRGQLVTLLRRGPQPVDVLAESLGLTPNAVRAHLLTLERDGLVRQRGTRRNPGAGKPATLFELHPDAETMMSRAYAPVLRALLEELASTMPADALESLLDGLGRRLASGNLPSAETSAPSRVEAGAEVLRSLGGLVEVEERNGLPVIRGHGCPLAVAVERRPEACRAVQSLLREVVGCDVRLCCSYEDRPSCCFEVPAA
ncbi:MAG TPA: ArsR family transcriptional regulator [Gemmatimonadales bacterium]|nr:ArsR family transcriptional regulator [Gemmatimonadales bacterium]